MTLQVFRGRTLEEARSAAVAALGRDAVVVTTRNVRQRGLTGLLGGSEVEVVASPPDLRPARGKKVARSLGPFVEEAYAPPPPPKPARDPVASLRNELRNEVRSIRSSLARSTRDEDIAGEIAALREAVAELTPTAGRESDAAAIVRERGIEGDAAAQLVQMMRDRPDGASVSLGERLRDAVADMVEVGPFPITAGQRQVVALVGASGVGKTTTLAKLAAHALENRQTVTFVTCDTFRVGGLEHARRYAGLLDVPFRAARTPSELRDIVTRCPSDVVLVDTSGRQPNTSAAESWLAQDAFEASLETEGLVRRVLLCVPAGLRSKDAARALRLFSPLGPTALAVTKLDETDQPAGVVHASFAARLPITLLSTGPSVPEDIAPATKGKLLDALEAADARRAS